MLSLLLLFFQIAPPITGTAPLPTITDPGDLLFAYDNAVNGWIAAVSGPAQTLFWLLAGVEFAWIAVDVWRQWRSESGLHFPTFLLVHRLLLVGFFVTLLNNGPVYMRIILQGFVQIGKAGTGMPDLSPSMIMGQGLQIALNLLGQAVLTGFLADPITGLVLVIVGIVIFLCFILITLTFIVTWIEMDMAIGMGSLMLAFGGSRWTRNKAERVFDLALCGGVKLLAIYFLIGAGWFESQAWITKVQSVGISGNPVGLALSVAGGAVIYASVVWSVPRFVSGMLSGSLQGSHQDVLSVVGASMAAATSATMIASGMGGGMGALAAGGSGAITGGGGARSAAMTPTASAHVPSQTA